MFIYFFVFEGDSVANFSQEGVELTIKGLSIEEIRRGHINLLYMHPEVLFSNSFRDVLRSVKY